MGRHVKKNSIANIAQEAGVSAYVVSSVINNRPGVSDTTRQRIQKVLNRVGYSRSYKLSTGRTIGLLLPIWDDWYVSALVRGILAYVSENDCNIATIIHHYRNGSESLLKALRTHNCDVALTSLSDQMIPDIERIAAETEMPFVVTNRSLRGITFNCDVSNRIGYINNNSYQGSFDMCKYLIGLKHRRIAFIFRSARLFSENQEDRIKGWKDAMRENGMEASEINELLFDVNNGTIPFKEKKISAVMCVDDTVAVACLRFCHEKHIHVPEEITVTGFGNMNLCSELPPPLTSVDQKTKEVGYLAAKYAHELATGKCIKAPSIVLPTEIVIRKSSAEVNCNFKHH